MCGSVGVGIGKAADVSTAISNGKKDAKRHQILVPLTSSASIPHWTKAKTKAAKVILLPSASGSGVIAGSSIRIVLELAGIKNILAKRLGSDNQINNANATIKALSTLKKYKGQYQTIC
jgi:small subunit ribosomal protein S5